MFIDLHTRIACRSPMRLNHIKDRGVQTVYWMNFLWPCPGLYTWQFMMREPLRTTSDHFRTTSDHFVSRRVAWHLPLFAYFTASHAENERSVCPQFLLYSFNVTCIFISRSIIFIPLFLKLRIPFSFHNSLIRQSLEYALSFCSRRLEKIDKMMLNSLYKTWIHFQSRSIIFILSFLDVLSCA